MQGELTRFVRGQRGLGPPGAVLRDLVGRIAAVVVSVTDPAAGDAARVVDAEVLVRSALGGGAGCKKDMHVNHGAHN